MSSLHHSLDRALSCICETDIVTPECPAHDPWHRPIVGDIIVPEGEWRIPE